MSDQLIYALVTYGPAIAMVVLFYFLIYRPDKAKKDARAKMLSMLHKGNRVMTGGGIYGEIVKIDKEKNVIDLKIADKVIIQVNRAAIQTNLSQQNKEAKEAAAEAGEDAKTENAEK